MYTVHALDEVPDTSGNEHYNLRNELLVSASRPLVRSRSFLRASFLVLALPVCGSPVRPTIIRQPMISRAQTRSEIAYGGRSRAGGGPSYGGASASVGVTIPDVIRMGTSASRLFPIPEKLTLSLKKYCDDPGVSVFHSFSIKASLCNKVISHSHAVSDLALRTRETT